MSALVSPVLAQTVTTASLKGRIHDERGEGIPGVLVSLGNPGAAVASQTAVTDLSGDYAFKLLPPAYGYTLKASVPGYATIVAGPFELHPGRATVQDLTLKPSAEMEETIRVEARGEIVDTSSTKTSTTYGAEFIEGLPLLGRRFNDILTLAPGVSDADGDGNPNVRGARDTGLQLRLDGTNVTDPLTGHFGQDINLETIEEIEIITSGASAEYGRADGGFANIITKSGGNDTEGSVKIFFRSSFLDGDGARTADARTEPDPVPEFSDTRSFFTLGGAFVRDRFWYFSSVERLDREVPVVFTTGESTLRTLEGWNTFAKVTWQADADNKLAFQLNYDPLERGGNYIGSRTTPESDYLLRTGGPLLQAKWTAIISPTLLMETLVSRLDGGQAILPVSDDFRIIEVEQARLGEGDVAQTFAKLPCRTTSCQGKEPIFTLKRTSVGLRRPRTIESIRGPYFFKDDDQRERTTLKADLSYTIEDRAGSHAIKSGFEFTDERYEDEPINNPLLIDQTSDQSQFATAPSNPLPPSVRYGDLLLEVSEPVRERVSAEGFNAGAYAQDSWKPRPNLTVNAGVRFDNEEIVTKGFRFFEPKAEAQEILRRFDILCDADSSCEALRDPGRTNKGLANPVDLREVDPEHPAHSFDLDGDGFVDLSRAHPEFANYIAPLTSFNERLTEGFSVTNANLAPRLSVSWDPWGDGRTKLFGTWNQYYDRLFLGTVTTEQGPSRFTAVWTTNGPGQQAEPGGLSRPLTGIVSVSQVERGLATPYTIEWSLGVERELAPEWAVSLTYVSRRGKDLLQDLDVNHITCEGFGGTFDVDPMDVCGDGGSLELDRFGQVVLADPGDPASPFVIVPNGAIDLYNLNPYWNQILRTGNFNSSTYASTELALRKRLHRNWQMQLSYTHSKAIGEAEMFQSLAGNDPAVSDVARGFLDYDQRHVLKWQGVTHLPHDLILGGTLQWASGLPYSLISTVSDLDDHSNLIGQRTFFLTGEKNDQRNEGQWTISGRIEKAFLVGKTHLSAFLSGENLTDSDDLRIEAVRLGAQGGGSRFEALRGASQEVGLDGTRRFGRRWELGVAVEF